jgi:hypothetical protein
VRGIDVKGREIEVFKTLINKGFSGIEIFLMVALPKEMTVPGNALILIFVGTYQLVLKMIGLS